MIFGVYKPRWSVEKIVRNASIHFAKQRAKHCKIGLKYNIFIFNKVIGETLRKR